AQSRDEPLPYSFPARTISGVPSARYFSDASKIDICSFVGRYRVTPPSTPGTSPLRSRMFAKVPRTITSWFPRRAPYELKSATAQPVFWRYSPAGELGLMLPAGLMWSVVTESPKIARARAPDRSFTLPGLSCQGMKYGGSRT